MPQPVSGFDDQPDAGVGRQRSRALDRDLLLSRLARRRAQSSNERGYVTAETALLLPALVGFGYALVLLVLIAADQIRCADAAWEVARALSRGSPPMRLSALASQYAPDGAHVSASAADGVLTVVVGHERSLASSLLPAVHVVATASVPCEPGANACGG